MWRVITYAEVKARSKEGVAMSTPTTAEMKSPVMSSESRPLVLCLCPAQASSKRNPCKGKSCMQYHWQQLCGTTPVFHPHKRRSVLHAS